MLEKAAKSIAKKNTAAAEKLAKKDAEAVTKIIDQARFDTMTPEQQHIEQSAKKDAAKAKKETKALAKQEHERRQQKIDWLLYSSSMVSSTFSVHGLNLTSSSTHAGFINLSLLIHYLAFSGGYFLCCIQ